MTANLLSRLQGLTAPDREVDLALAKALVPDVIVMRQREDDTGADQYTHWQYTASIDDAVALCERVLPGYDWTVEKSGGRGFAGVGQSFNEEAATPAIALLIAILTALEARDGTE